MHFLKIGLIFLALAVFISACGETTAPNTTTTNTANNSVTQTSNNTTAQPTATMDELAEGRKLFKEYCVRCHQQDGTGGKVEIEGTTLNPEDLTTDKMKKMADDKYVKYISDGIPDEGMPPFKNKMTEEQIKDVIKFIRKEFQGM